MAIVATFPDPSSRIRSVLSAFGVAIVALTWGYGCEPAQAQTELKVVVANFTGERVDPRNGGMGMVTYQGPMFDFLVTMDKNRRPIPGIAEKWSISPDGRTYTFFLRPMKFHNGDDLTAEDVKFSFDRLAGGTGAFISSIHGVIESMTVKGPHEIEIKLKQPSINFLEFLGPGDTTVGAIVPKKYIEKVGNEAFAQNPVGSGPWKLIERKPGAYFLFEAVPDHPFRPAPGYDRLRISLVPEESTRVAMLDRGDADIINIGFDSLKIVEAGGHQILGVPNSVLVSVNFIGIWEPKAEEMKLPTRFSNTKVREALGLAINRNELLEFLVAGKGMLAERFPSFPGGFGFNPDWAKHAMPYDVARAKKLLAEAGYPQGFSIKLYTLPLSGIPWAPRMAQVIADYWSRIGVKTSIVSTEFGAFGPIVYGRPDSALGSAYTWRITNTSMPIGRMTNYVSANGKALIALVPWDDQFAELQGVSDTKEREKKFIAFQDKLAESKATIPLFYVNAVYAARKEIAGWTPYSGWPSLGLSLEYFKPQK